MISDLVKLSEELEKIDLHMLSSEKDFATLIEKVHPANKKMH
jgi:hypothetical protein